MDGDREEIERLLQELDAGGAKVGPIMMMAVSGTERTRNCRRRQDDNLYLAKCEVDGKMIERMLDVGILSKVDPEHVGRAILELAKMQMIAMIDL